MLSDLSYVFYNRLLSSVKGPVILLVIIKYLSPDEQGLWYLFLNLGALSVVVDFGFTTLVTQYISNSFGKFYDNDKVYKYPKNVLGLSYFALKSFFFLSILGLLILLLCGLYFIPNSEIVLWLLYSVILALNVFLSAAQAIYTGLDKVKEVQSILLVASTVSFIFQFILIIFGFSIFSLVIASGLSLLVSITLFLSVSKNFWKIVLKEKILINKQEINSIINLQKKYTISWIAGYFIFNAYVPIISKSINLEVAGKFGLVIAIFSMFLSLSLSWVFTKTPKMGMLAGSEKKYEMLKVWKKSSLKGLFLLIFFMLIFYISIQFFPNFLDWKNRILNHKLIFMFSIIFFVRYISSVVATLIRVNKLEKMMTINSLNAIFCILILSTSNFSNIENVMLSISLWSILVILPFIILIYNNFKKFNV